MLPMVRTVFFFLALYPGLRKANEGNEGVEGRREKIRLRTCTSARRARGAGCLVEGDESQRPEQQEHVFGT